MASAPPSRCEVQQHIFSLDLERPAALPSKNPTHAFWTHSSPDANPLAREGSTGPLTTDADICIIGSGFTGVGVAYHLSEAMKMATRSSPLRVVIVEARDFCSGATGRNGGHLTPDPFRNFRERTLAYGPEEAKRSYALEAHVASSIVRLVHTHGWTDDVDLVQGGHVTLLFSDAEANEMQRDREAAVDAGWSLEGVVTMSKEEVEAIFGAHYPACRYPSHNVWPLKLVTKIFRLAKSYTGPLFELTLHTHTPVTAVHKNTSANANRAFTLSTPRGTISCSRVVHATNAYASHLLPMLAGPKGIMPVRGQVIATRASVGAEQITTTGWDANEGFEYWFPRPVKAPNEKPLIIIGGGRDASHPTFEAYVDDDTTCHPKVGETLRAFLPAVFEGKFEPGQEPEMEWTGIMGYTKTKDPFVGPVDKLAAVRGSDQIGQYAGQFIAAGYTGHGMPRAFGCAEVVAQMILAELAGTAWTQPEWLPTRYLTWEDRERVTPLN